MFRRLLSVGGYTALSRLTGFGRDIMMAIILGAGPISDAFLVAFRLPNNFRAIFAEGSFNLAFLPRYAALRARFDSFSQVGDPSMDTPDLFGAFIEQR